MDWNSRGIEPLDSPEFSYLPEGTRPHKLDRRRSLQNNLGYARTRFEKRWRFSLPGLRLKLAVLSSPRRKLDRHLLRRSAGGPFREPLDRVRDWTAALA